MSDKNEKRMKLIGELLTQQMNHWMLFPLLITIMGCMYMFADMSRPDTLMWLICGILPVLTFLARLKLTRFFPFLAGNLLILALTFFIPAENMVCRILCVLCGAGYFLHTFFLRLKAESVYTTPFSPVFGIAVSVSGICFLRYVNAMDWDAYYIFPLAGCLALQLIISYINRYLHFLTVNKTSSGAMPVAEMFRSGLKLVLGYTLTGTVLLLLSTNLTWLETLLHAIKRGLIAVLRFLFSLFSGSEQAEELLYEPQGAVPDRSGALELPEGESSLFWEILEAVAVLAALCIMVFGIVRFILWLIRFLRERFRLDFGRQSLEIKEGQAEDIRERCERKKEKKPEQKREGGFFSFLSPAERVRRLYKKKLLGASRQLTDGEHARLALYTAREAEKKLETGGMAAIYEKARYSSAGVSAEDVRRMKEICR